MQHLTILTSQFGVNPLSSLFLLIPIALVFVAIAVKAFLWAVNNHQFDDLDAAANSILFDDVDVLVKGRESDGTGDAGKNISADSTERGEGEQ